MAVPKKVEFTAGKIIETPTSTGVANEITTLAGTLANQIECTHFSARINPSVTNEEIRLSNITTAKLVVLNPNGALSVRLNGITSPPVVLSAGPTVLFATISGLFATNPSSSVAVDLEVYASSDVG